jgi:hypothetical protein
LAFSNQTDGGSIIVSKKKTDEAWDEREGQMIVANAAAKKIIIQRHT